MGSKLTANAIAFDSRTDFFEIRTVMAQAATKMNDADIVQYEPLNLLEEGWIGFVIRIAAVLAILVSCCPKFAALIKCMPTATLGGVSLKDFSGSTGNLMMN